MNISTNIKNLRTVNHISSKKLAKKLKVPREAIDQWENENVTPDISHIKIMSRLFKVTTEQFINEPIDMELFEKNRYSKEYDKFSLKLALGVAFIPLFIFITGLFVELFNELYESVGVILVVLTLFSSIYLIISSIIIYVIKISSKKDFCSDVAKEKYYNKLKWMGYLFFFSFLFMMVSIILYYNIGYVIFIIMFGIFSIVFIFFMVYLILQSRKYKHERMVPKPLTKKDKILIIIFLCILVILLILLIIFRDYSPFILLMVNTTTLISIFLNRRNFKSKSK